MKARAALLVEATMVVAALLYGVVATGGAAGRASAGSSVVIDGPGQSGAARGDGRADNWGGYRLVPVTLPAAPGPAVPVAFRILRPGGAPLTSYDVVHTKRLHLYVVHDDLSGYQHVHPRLVGDTWRAALALPDGGAYRLFAEFTPAGGGPTAHPIVLGTPFSVPGAHTRVRLPPPTDAVTVDGYTVRRRDGTAPLTAGRAKLLTFAVTQGPDAVRLEEFLDASAHASAFEAGTLAFAHMHPTRRPGPNGTATIHVQFAQPGEQRLYLQFQVDGAVHQAAFTITVA